MLNKYIPFKRLLTESEEKRSYYLEVFYLVLVIMSYFSWPFEGGFEVLGDYILFIIWMGIVLLLLAITNINIRKLIIPSALIYPLFGLVVSFKLLQSFLESNFQVILGSILGLLILGGLTVSIYVYSKGKWIGYGDVRLASVVGLLLGYQLSILAAVTFAILLIMTITILKLNTRTKGLKIPSAPIWIATVLICFIFGSNIIDIIIS